MNRLRRSLHAVSTIALLDRILHSFPIARDNFTRIGLTSFPDQNCFFLSVPLSHHRTSTYFHVMGIHTPHDILYHEFFTHPKLVEELLRNFVDEKFINDLDFSTLRTEDTCLITKGLKKRTTDLIYEISFRGKPVFIYLLLELQSTVDRFMADRLLEYIRAFSRKYCRTHGTDLYPPVFPVVLYNGDRPWSAPTQFSDLVAPSPIPSQYIPQFSYFLIEINKIPKRKLLRVRNALSAIFYVESSSREEISRSLDSLIQFIRNDLPAVYPKFLTWFFEVQDVKLTPTMAKKLQNELEVNEMLRTKVLAERESFFQEGVVFDKQHTLVDLVGIKFGHSEKAERKIKSVRSTDRLEKALKRVLTAETREDVLKCLD